MTVTMPAIIGLLPASRPGAPPPMPLAEPGFIESRMLEAGLLPVETGEFAGALAFPNAAATTRAVLAASARAIRHSGLDAVTNAVAATLGPVTKPDGTVVFDNRFRWVKATPG